MSGGAMLVKFFRDVSHDARVSPRDGGEASARPSGVKPNGQRDERCCRDIQEGLGLENSAPASPTI